MKTITPFSNGTEFMIWHNNNCSQCKKYENKSTIRSRAGCKYAFDIELACVSDGEIPLKSAQMIGYKDNRLSWECLYKNVILKPITLDLTVFQQKRLDI